MKARSSQPIQNRFAIVHLKDGIATLSEVVNQITIYGELHNLPFPATAYPRSDAGALIPYHPP
jgi:hypothetical protein